MNDDDEKLDEILGVSFGDIVPDLECVLVDFHIRANASYGGKEGTRGNVLVHTDVLRGLIAGLPEVISAMQDDGAACDKLPAPKLPVPAWNEGPKWNPGGAPMYQCMGIGVRDILPDLGATVMIIRAAGAGTPRGEYDSADYLIGWSALLAFQEALPKVVQKLERVGNPAWRRQ